MKYFVLILAFVFLGFFLLGTNTSYSQTDSFDEMSYSQFLDFCHRYNPALWDSMSIEERLLSNLCDFVGKSFGEKQWTWLNGAKLDWESFAKNASENYVDKIPEFTGGGTKETLHVDSFVSGRDSFPPPMMAMISFDYEKLSQVIHYDEKFIICIDGKLVPQDSFIECSDEYVKYDFTKEEPFSVPKFAKKIPLPEHTMQQMSDWCQNSPKWAEIDKQFWNVIPVRLISNTDEFKSLQGIKESFVVNSNAMEYTCPPNAWLLGTFASEDGNRYRFALEYDSDYFRYRIDGEKSANDGAIQSPLQQTKMGVPLYEIKCKEGLELIFRSSNDSPACVKPETKQRLIERGWTASKGHVLSNSVPILPKFEITGLNYATHLDEPLIISVEKIGYSMCDSWDAKIVDVSDNSVVWERDSFNSCVVLDPPKQQKFEYEISNENRPIVVSKSGKYVFQITIGGTYLEQEFVVRNNFSSKSLDRLIYPTIIVSSSDHDPNPSSIVLQIGVNNTTYWKNESNVPVILTSEDERWSTGLIPPNEGKIIQFNETAFYKYRGLPSTTINGRIAILSDQTESLPIWEKLAIAREIIKVDMGPPITAIGIGNADNVLAITIHEDELEKNPNAEEYYKKRYQNMIPFEVPIRIKFGHMEPQ